MDCFAKSMDRNVESVDRAAQGTDSVAQCVDRSVQSDPDLAGSFQVVFRRLAFFTDGVLALIHRLRLQSPRNRHSTHEEPHGSLALPTCSSDARVSAFN